MSQCLQSSESGNLQEPCIPHEKEHKLFCTDCNKAFCGACMDQGKHDFHQICALASVYNEKISVVKDKLKQLEKYQDEWRSGSSAYERNLRLLEKAETFLRNDIAEIIAHAEQDLTSMTNDRKNVLSAKLEQTTKNTKVLTDLNSKVDQLSMNQFLQQFAEIDLQCDKLIGAPEPVTLQSVDDIHCRLVPPYQFEQVIYPGFFKAKHNDEHNVMIKSAHDVEWKLTVNKSDSIRISLRATDSQVATFRHALTIVIPHPDYTKEIRQTFNMDTEGHTFNVLIMHKILEQEFCNPGGDLVMKIGIRPLNSIVEKQLAIYQYVQLKEANENLTKRLTYFTDQYDYKHLTMYFNIELELFKRYRFLKSYGIYDGENREWRMNIKLNSKNMIAAHIQLISGAGTECRFFIELEHMNLQKSIRKNSICKKFDFGNGTKPMWGFNFIEFDELKADAGFLRNNLLHFRFGVRPLLSTTVVYGDSRTLIKSDGGPTSARKTAATTPAEPNVRRTILKSRGGRKLVRKTAAKTHAKQNVRPLLPATEAIDGGSTSLETGNGSPILKSSGDCTSAKETAAMTHAKQNVRPLLPATEAIDGGSTSLEGGNGSAILKSGGDCTSARETAEMAQAKQNVRPLSPDTGSGKLFKNLQARNSQTSAWQTAAMTPAEPYIALYSPASEVFGGGRSLLTSSSDRTTARQTATMTPVDPTVRPLLPATESDGDRQTVRQTAAKTPAEPNEGTSNPAKEKHVSFVE